MAIAVQSDSAYDARPFVALRHALECIVDNGLISGLQVSRDEVVIEHARLLKKMQTQQQRVAQTIESMELDQVRRGVLKPAA